MKSPIFLFLAALLLCGDLAAQDGKLKLNRAAFVPERAAAGSTVVLEVEITPKSGWHFYGKLEQIGVKPSLVLAKASSPWLKPVGEFELPDGHRHASGGIDSYWITERTTLRQNFRIADEAVPGELRFAIPLNYMVCDAKSCDPPRDLAVAATLTITPAAPAATARPKGADTAEIGMNTGHLSITGLRCEPQQVAPGQEVTVLIDVKPDVGWHFYGAKEELGEPPSLTLELPDGITKVGGFVIPDGTRHETFGMTTYWVAAPSTLQQRLRVAPDAAPGQFTLKGTFRYMACDESLCDPSLDVDIGVLLTVAADAAATPPLPPVADAVPTATTPSSAGADVAPADGLGQIGLLSFLLLAVGAGLLALAMPCTYPMIPITISFFTKQAKDRGGSALPLSLAYGAGIVVIFIAIGLIAGPAIVPFATHPVTNLVIGVMFVVFGFALFGWLHLNPPEFLMRGAAQASTTGGYLGVFLMGATLVVTSFTCTMPFVGSLLSFGARSGNYGRMALGMGVFGLTMAVPFVLLSLVPGRVKAMPKSGEWMNTLKVTLGFIELAAALKFLSNAELVWGWRILPRELFLVIWAAIGACATLYLLGFIKLHGESGEIGPGRLVAGIVAMVLTFYFSFGALGYRLDNRVMLAFEPPYSAERLGALLTAPGQGPAVAQANEHVIVTDDFDRAVAVAREKQMAVLVNFTGLT